MNIINALPGDKLSRPKGVFTHTGIYIGHDQVFHSTPGRGPHISSLNEFAAGKLVTVDPANDADRPAILARVRSELERQQQYDPVFNNCQHVSSRAQVGHATSEDLIAITLLTTMLILAFMMSRGL